VITLLICDDASAFATLIEHWMRDCGDVEVVGVARSAAQCCDMAEALNADVILIDHLLPDATSEALVPQLRVCAPQAALVIASGMPHDVLEMTAKTAGADGFISKASRPEDFRAAVRAAAQRRCSGDVGEAAPA
jgi:DNA-binding NarL/FixJ family response regulator